MKNALSVAVAAAATMLFAACVKEPLDHLTQEETRIYVTDHDSSAVFNSYRTFSIQDSVAVVDGHHSYKERNATDSAYIAAVAAQMSARGYVPVADGSGADLEVHVNRIYSTTTGVIDYDDYWDYYGGYWDPYYDGFGGYPYYVSYGYNVYTVREGALSVDILDLKNAQAKNRISLVWTGLVRGESILNASAAPAQVQALFDQSSYLKAN